MSVDFPPYDESCEDKPAENASQSTDFTSCDEAGVVMCWDYDPAYCDRKPQGYRIYRTTTPPVNQAESLCLSFIGLSANELEDRSSWNHRMFMLSGSDPLSADSTSTVEPLFTRRTPFGISPTIKSLNLYRVPEPPAKSYAGPPRSKEYIKTAKSTQFNLLSGDFTIEFWTGNVDTPWKYYFPCQTLAACYDSSENKRGWRVYLEPDQVTAASTGLTGQPVVDSINGSLVVEFYENGDGTGNMVREVITGLSSGNENQAPTGTTSRNGFMHVSILRESGVLKIYLDGVLRASQYMPWFVAFNDQPVTIGRHYGSSGRIEPDKYLSPVDVDDGANSHLHGCIFDFRITLGYVIAPPPGGQPADLCNRPAWFTTFDLVDVIPGGVRCWEDTDPTYGTDVFYRVAAVNCDVDVPCRCPSYIQASIADVSKYSTLWVTNQADLQAILQSKPPTLLDIFNEWDRTDPTTNDYFYGGLSATGNHARWYFDNTLESFVQPENSSHHCIIASPGGYYQTRYTHEVVVQSNHQDDDTVSSVGAINHDPSTGATWALVFSRTNSGQAPHRGWGAYVLGPGYNSAGQSIPGYDVCGLRVGPTTPNPNSYASCAYESTAGSDGWSGRTSSIQVKRDNNIIQAWCTPFGRGSTRKSLRTEASWPEIGGVYDPGAMIEIDFNSTPPPAGLPNWDMFRNKPTGVGFHTQSQSQSFYNDWFYDPLIKQQVFDFTNGAPGEVWEWSEVTGRWYKTLDTAFEFVGSQATEITDPTTGLVAKFDCDGTLTV